MKEMKYKDSDEEKEAEQSYVVPASSDELKVIERLNSEIESNGLTPSGDKEADQSYVVPDSSDELKVNQKLHSEIESIDPTPNGEFKFSKEL